VRKSRKGISSILGTVIIIAITIALGALLYAYSQGMFGNLTQNVNVNAQAQIIVNPSSGNAYLQLTLTNNGNTNVEISSVTVSGNVVQNASGISLQPGQTYQNVFTLSGNFTAGKYYTVIILGKTSTGKSFSIALNVLASETA
jgi:flagellin-like protein